MAILIKKENNILGTDEKVYVMIANIKYGTNQSDGPQVDTYGIYRKESMEVEYRVFSSKKSRDRCVLVGFIQENNYKNFSGVEPIWDEEVASAYSYYSKDDYNQNFIASILSPRDFYELDKKIGFSSGGALGMITHYSEVLYKKEMSEWPTDTSRDGLHSWAYGLMKRGIIGKGAISTRLHPEYRNTIEDDFESVTDILKRMAIDYPEILKIPSDDFKLTE